MEPFITSSLNVSQKIPNRQVSGLTTGVVVYSEVGPLAPTRVTSPREFLDLYTVNKTLTKGDHPSLHNAYFLSRSTDLVVTRATNTKVYSLEGLGGEVDSVLLPNGKYSDSVETIAPQVPTTPGDYRSLWLQIDNVLFVGTYPDDPTSNPNQDGQPFYVSPFQDGIGDTATKAIKGTTEADLEAAGLGTEDDWVVVPLSGELVDSGNNINTAILPEIAKAFKGGGAAERDNIHVVLNGSNEFEVHYSSDYPVNNTNFTPADGFNLSTSANMTTLGVGSEPYLIGYKNVGSVHTLKAWVSDVVSVDGFQYWNLNIYDSINGLNTYKVSDNPTATDAQANPIYYTWIEEVRPDIIYIKNESSTLPVSATAEPTSPNVGKSEDFILSTSTTAELLSSAAYAASSFEEYEGTRIQLYSDAGWYNAMVGKALESVASRRQGLACIGIDPVIKDINVIKSYAASYSGYYSIVHTNGGKDTSIVGFQIPISPSCYYIESVARNTTRNASYAPTFSKVNGTITEGNLYHKYTKSQRDELNKARVNVLVYDNTDGVSYLNNNLLRDNSGSLIDEDQSIRLINDIQFDVEKLMENFYSRFNVAGTRAAVVTAIDNYMRTNILSQSYTIDDYEIECSSVNNNDVTIQNNELKVELFIKLNHSIKYITVVTNVVPTL